MRRALTLLAAVLSLALVAAACGNDAEETAEEVAEEVQQEVEGTADQEELVVTLEEQNDSGISGEATLTVQDGQVVVVVELENAGSGPQPIHIHSGTCENLGDVVHPLTDVTDGRSETTVDVTLDQLVEGEFSINAHKSPEEIEVYVACGEIT